MKVARIGMGADLRADAVLWAPVPDGHWPAIVLRRENAHCSVRLLGEHPYAISELHVPHAKLINYQLNLHHACARDAARRALLYTACNAAQNAGLNEQRALFALDPFKNFLALLQSRHPAEHADGFVLPALADNANEELRVAYNHLRTTDTALRSKRAEANEARNNLIVQQLRHIAVQCRTLAIERENSRAHLTTREIDDEVATLKLSRKAAFTYYRTLQPPPPPETVAQDLERAKNEAAHWKRQYEEVQKELSADKKRRKTDDGVKKEEEEEEEEELIPKQNGEVKSSGDSEKVVVKTEDSKGENGVTPTRANQAESTTANNNAGSSNDATNNLQMMAEVLSSMRTTAQPSFETKSDAQSSGGVRRQSGSPETQTQAVKRRSRSSPSTPDPAKAEASPVKPHALVDTVNNILATKDTGEKAGSNATLEDGVDDLDVRNSFEGMKPYAEAKRNIGIKMLSKKYADANPFPDEPSRAFLADLDAFQDEHGEKPPKQMKIDGGPLCSFKLMRIVCGHGGIRNVVQNGQMRSVMYEVGVKKVTNSTRIKCYYAQNLYRYEHMLVHGVLLPKGVGEKIKTLTWRKGRTLAGTFSSDVPAPEVAQASASTVGDNTSDRIDNNFAK